MSGDPTAVGVTAELRVLNGALARPEPEPTGFTVMTITGSEAVSELFSFDMVVLVSPEQLHEADEVGGLERALLMHDVAFRLGPDGNLRFGMVCELDLEGPFEFAERLHARLRLRVVPRAWILTQRRNSRIFQHEYVHEIVSRILHESGVRHRWELVKTYPRRIYCTQYEETDYEFVRRLLAEEGVLFFFEFRHEFAGGDRAKVELPKGEFADALDAIDKANTVFKSAAKEAQGIAKKTGNEREEGAFGALGSVAGLVGDLLDMPEDEEAPLPRVLGWGEAGPSGDGDVFVFADTAAAYGWGLAEDDGARVLELRLRDQAGLTGNTSQIDRLAPGWKTRPEHVETRDYDFRRPLLELKARVGEPLEPDDPPPGLPLEIYDHHGEYTIEDVSLEGAELQREQYRRDAALANGRGRSARVMAGHKFRMTAMLERGREIVPPDGDYAVTRVHHQYENPDFAAGGTGDVDGVVRGCARAIREALVSGRDLPETELRHIIHGMRDGSGAPRIYQNRFECIDAQLAFRPPRPTRLLRHVTETATVMGPPGQDIYHDKYGRVKVQFHWDRQGKYDAKSSCWLRVVQPWAGAGYGFQFFPRIGMEVLVTFLGGDTDRPVVVGALYNGTHGTPEILPERMTRSGIRTQTSPKGGGFNELSFEDAREKERVFIHAQRNFECVVQHDHDMTVGNRLSFSVGGDQRSGVAGDQRFTVGGNRSNSVGGDSSLFVKGSHTSRVTTNQLQLVEGNNNLVVGGANVRRVNESDLTSVKGVYNVTARAGASFMVTGGVETNTSATAFVKGSAYLTASQRVVVRTQEEEDPAVIRLECGTSVLELHPDRIVMIADDIGFRARQRFDTNAQTKTTRAGRVVVKGDEITLETPDANAHLMLRKGDGGNALLHGGQQVCLNSPGTVWLNAATLDLFGDQTTFAHMEGSPTPSGARRVSRDAPPAPPPNVTLRFTHLATDHSEPLADTHYRAVAGEHTHEGTTDGNGQIQIYVPDDVSFADVTLFAHEKYPDIYPDPMPLVWNIAITGQLAPASEHMGAAIRLKNLGYDLAVPASEDDPSFVEALTAFQFDHKLAETGENDEETQNKLQEVYGS